MAETERKGKHVEKSRRRDSEGSQVANLHLTDSLKTVPSKNATSGLRNTTLSPTWRNTSYGSCARSIVVGVVAAETKTKTRDSSRK